MIERVTAPSGAPLRFSILLTADTASPRLAAGTLRALASQAYPDWEVLLPAGLSVPDDVLRALADRVHRIDEGGASAKAGEWLTSATAAASGDWLVPLQAGDQLAANALAQLAHTAQIGSPSVLYGDCDVVGPLGVRSRPWLKPAWNTEQFLSQDYISQACAIAMPVARATAAAADAHPGCAAYAMLLEAVLHHDVVPHHLPYILVHLPKHRHEHAPEARERAVAGALGERAARIAPGPFGSLQVTWPLPDPAPLVSILIPTRDRAAILRTCIDSLLALTRYPAFEVVVIDNDSSEPEALDYLAQLAAHPAVRVVRSPGLFNFSAINNFAVAQACGDYLCLLNNDTEVVDGEWLAILMAQATRTDVGAVGPMLLYPDGTIQHAGVVIGMGNAAGHAHRHQRTGSPGYFAQAHIAREVSAVTAACLVVARHKYKAVGGLDAANLAVAYNDVDLCLKLRAAGWRNIYVPHTRLIHHESKSRPSDLSSAQIDRYMAELGVLQVRWGTDKVVDPLHHPLLDRSSETYQINLQA
ncbi:glycosyltransferase family 2 protein [Novosphingobium sp.]|uniref:glycosyltransferase family 2 protein n=1 Tax=Novosphingobium sp. TaxID=1874826 RepID=UPI0038BA6F1A